jgi:ketosteroid isomerase-like protein
MRAHYQAVAIVCVVMATVAPCAVAADSPKAEVEKFYASLEKMLNSEAFAKDPAIGLGYYDPRHTRFFDTMEPEEFTGEVFTKHFIEVSKAFPTEKVTFVSLSIHADSKLAFASYIQVVTGKTPDGKQFDIRLRTNDGLEKLDGKWRIVDEGVSLPLDNTTH